MWQNSPMFMESITEQSSENCAHNPGEYESLQTIECNFDETVNEFIKSLSWIDKDGVQSYDGRLLSGNLHSGGHYVWSQQVFRPLSENLVTAAYEGTFYASTKEGYGLLSYKNNSTFEGLFKSGQPFGPGVFTESTGSQNVGIWRGSRLYRIYIAIEGVPKIAETSAAKIKLMQFRKLVPAEEDSFGVRKDFTKLVLRQMRGSEDLIAEAHSKLFNPDARSPKSLFFDRISHEKAYFNEPSRDDDDVNKKASPSEFTASSAEVTRAEERPKDTPAFLVAWNNEPFMVDVLSHVYRHRAFERDLTFDVGALVTGQRERWRCRGEHEEVALAFLTAAADGAKEQVRRIVTFFALDENVSDARGNNAVHLAAAGDFRDLVTFLVREGVNVNQQNDEGMTPLTMSLARYVAVANRATSWELAFLPPASEMTPRPEQDDSLKWNLRRSAPSVLSEEDDDAALEAFKAQLARPGGADLVAPPRKYLLSLRPLPVLPRAREGQKGKKGGLTEQETKSKKNPQDDKKVKKKDSSATQASVAEDGGSRKKAGKVVLDVSPEEGDDPRPLSPDELHLLSKIEDTVDLLLDLGADPNAGQTPSTPLVLSLFARNTALTEKLLVGGALARAVPLNFGLGLTPLHVACLMAPCAAAGRLARLLAAHGADPQAAADLAFDAAAKDALLTGLEDVEQGALRGMTPLEALVLRTDFAHSPETAGCLKDLLNVMVDIGGEPAERIGYLGHSPLSLAAYRGDVDVVEALLALGTFDPNTQLGLGLGNVLAVLAAMRFFELFPVAARIEMCNLLVAHGADPLRVATSGGAGFRGNVVDFCDSEVRREIGKQANPKKLPKEVSAKLKEYKKLAASLLDRAKERLVAGVIGRVTVALAAAAREESDSVALLANLLTEAELVKCTVLLCEARQIAPTREEAAVMVAAVGTEDQGRAQFAGPTDAEILAYLDPFLAGPETLQTGLPTFSRPTGPFCSRPELDAGACVPTVCFECGRSDVPALESCPRCGLVAFCSKPCNKANVTRGGPFMHRCAGLFVGAKEPVPVERGQLWKKGKGKDKKDKEKTKPKSVGPGLDTKSEFFKSLDFNDGRNYDKEETFTEVAEEAGVLAQEGDLPLEIGDECTVDTDVMPTGDASSADTSFRGSVEIRCCSRKRWKDPTSDRVTRDLLQVSRRLSKHGSLVKRGGRGSRSAQVLGRWLFPCSAESDVGATFQRVPAEGHKESGAVTSHRAGRDGPTTAARGVAGDRTAPVAANTAELFEKTSEAFDVLQAASGGSADENRVEPHENKRGNRPAARIDKKPKRKSGFAARGATYNPREESNRADGRCRKESIGGKTFACQVLRCGSPDRGGGKRSGNEAVEYIPVKAICALLKMDLPGADGLLLPYAVYKDGDLYYCAKEPSPPSCDNSSLV